ncbi:hypothetical protein [Pantoea stewartii]|uniref:hypothetical protein n=1 Tax=Pantoea stewartii TaxID=66269 RepID=UPI0019801558|nr:hypothetical protein [Pantoea stewartii]
MRATELIKILNDAVKEHGDLEVLIKNDGYFAEQSGKEFFTEPLHAPLRAGVQSAFLSKAVDEEDIHEAISGEFLIIGKTADRP